MSNTLGKTLKSLRVIARKSQEEIAKQLNVSRATIANWELERSQPDNYSLAKLADIFGVTVDYLLGRDDFLLREDMPKYGVGARRLEALAETYAPGPIVLLPVYEEAAAGAPCFVDERPIERRAVDATRVQHDLPNYILVRVAGDSMISAGIMPGGLVLVHRQDTVEDGQTALLHIKGDGVTIKRVRHMNGGRLLLIPRNPSMREEEYAADDVTICGRVVQAINDIE